MGLNKKVSIILGLPKSLYICFKYFKVKDALRLPILVSHRTKFVSLKGKIKCNTKIYPGMLKIGILGIGTNFYDSCVLELNGTLVLNGKVYFGGGSKICTVNQDSKLILGNNVSFTGNTHIVAKKSIKIEDNCTISWNTTFLDSDLHDIFDRQNKKINFDKEILIEKDSWIGCNVTLLKGAHIRENTIVGSGSIVNKEFEEKNCIIVNNVVKKRDIYWKK